MPITRQAKKGSHPATETKPGNQQLVDATMAVAGPSAGKKRGGPRKNEVIINPLTNAESAEAAQVEPIASTSQLPAIRVVRRGPKRNFDLPSTSEDAERTQPIASTSQLPIVKSLSASNKRPHKAKNLEPDVAEDTSQQAIIVASRKPRPIPPSLDVPVGKTSLKGKNKMRQEDVDAMMEMRAHEEAMTIERADVEYIIPTAVMDGFSVKANGKKRAREDDPTEPGPSKRVKVVEKSPKKVKPATVKKVKVKIKASSGKTGKRPTILQSVQWNVLALSSTKLDPSATAEKSSLQETTLRPRIWTNNREELLSMLPEMTGAKGFNGISWELYETPLLLLDEANTCFQVDRQNSKGPLFLDLITTRTFVCPRPQQSDVDKWSVIDIPRLPSPFVAPTVPIALPAEKIKPRPRRRYKSPENKNSASAPPSVPVLQNLETAITAKDLPKLTIKFRNLKFGKSLPERSLTETHSKEASVISPSTNIVGSSLPMATKLVSPSVPNEALHSVGDLHQPTSTPQFNKPNPFTSAPLQASKGVHPKTANRILQMEPPSSPVPTTVKPERSNIQIEYASSTLLLPFEPQETAQFSGSLSLEGPPRTTKGPAPTGPTDSSVQMTLRFEHPSARGALEYSNKPMQPGVDPANFIDAAFNIASAVYQHVFQASAAFQGSSSGYHTNHIAPSLQENPYAAHPHQPFPIMNQMFSNSGHQMIVSAPHGPSATGNMHFERMPPFHVGQGVMHLPLPQHPTDVPAIDKAFVPGSGFTVIKEEFEPMNLIYLQDSDPIPALAPSMISPNNGPSGILVNPYVGDMHPVHPTPNQMSSNWGHRGTLSAPYGALGAENVHATHMPGFPGGQSTSHIYPSFPAPAIERVVIPGTGSLHIPTKSDEEPEPMDWAYPEEPDPIPAVDDAILREYVPSPLPEELGALVDSYLFGRPLTIIMSNGLLEKHWSLKLPAEYGYAMMGYFKILGVQETRIHAEDESTKESMDKAQNILSGQVRWRIHLQWAPGGEESIFPEKDSSDCSLEHAWWDTPSSSTQEVLPEQVAEPAAEKAADAEDAEADPESSFPSTHRYRDARIRHHEYKFRHYPLNDLYNSVIPLHLLIPFGEDYMDTSFPRGWCCAKCGRINFQAAFRHRSCPSSLCNKGKVAAATSHAHPLFLLRDPQERLPLSSPINQYPESLTTTSVTQFPTGMQTFSYHLNQDPNIFMKHIFTSNAPPLQQEADQLLQDIQLNIPLIRPMSENTPYFLWSAKSPKDNKSPTHTQWINIPLTMNQAKEQIVNGIRSFGGLKDDQVAVNHLRVLAWITAGSKKGDDLIRAKNKAVTYLALGCTVILVVTPKAMGGLPTLGDKAHDAESGQFPKNDIVDHDETTSGWIADNHEDGAGAEETIEISKKGKTIAKASKPSFVITLMHGDMMVFYGDEFEYSVKREGTSLLLIASHDSLEHA